MKCKTISVCIDLSNMIIQNNESTYKKVKVLSYNQIVNYS